MFRQIVFLTNLLAIFALCACSPDEPRAEKPRPVRTVTAALTDSGEEIVLTGEIRPHVETDLGFRIDGRVVSRLVDIGAMVRKGQVLATLDPRDVSNQLQAAEADLRSAQSSESLTQLALDRQRALLRTQVVAQARVDEAETNWRTAVARRQAAAANLENARNRLAYARLLADEDGVVTAVGANPGQVVATGQMVVKVAATEERDAVFSVPEAVLANGTADFRVRVSLISDPSVQTVGSVRDVSPTADSVTRSYRVRIALPEAPAVMAFGATVSGQVVMGSDRLFVLPASALTRAGGSPAVYVVDPSSSTLRRTDVHVARYSATRIFVSSGLAPGEKVVVAGVSKLRPGQAVALGGDER